MKNSVVLFSGGQDSTTCLGFALKNYANVKALCIDYGQRHKIEIEQAQKIADALGVELSIFRTDVLSMLGNSALVGDGELDAPHSQKSELPASYVPNRNALFYTIAHAFTQKVGFDVLVSGVCQTDYSGYPDCREVFVKNMEFALNLGSNSHVEFVYPLMYLNKAQTFKMAEEHGVLELVIEESHTCYEGDRVHKHEWGYGCGHCPACKLRERGYREYANSRR